MADQKQLGIRSKENVDRFTKRWINNPRLPGQLKTDAQIAFRRVGLAVNKDLIVAMRVVDRMTPLVELRDRGCQGPALN